MLSYLSRDSMSEMLVHLACRTIEPIWSDALVEVAVLHGLVHFVLVEVQQLISLLLFFDALHPVCPVIWSLVDGLEVVFDMTVNFVSVVDNVAVVCGDLHHHRAGGLDSEYPVYYAIERPHFPIVEKLGEVPDVGCPVKFVAELKFLEIEGC